MNDKTPEAAQHQRKAGHAGHGWLMIACCIPMLAIAVALAVTGVVGVGFIVIAVACTAMMALMMRGMSHEDGGHEDRSHAGHHK